MDFGLCCKFHEEPIAFKTTTATHILKTSRDQQLAKLADLCMFNAQALLDAVTFCANNGIGSFRINSQILPLKTHPKAGYDMSDLPGHDNIVAAYERAGDFANEHNVRTAFHPDQFILLSTPKPDVLEKSVEELEYQAEVSEWVGADVINIHGGGAYGDKTAALKRLHDELLRLPSPVKERLTLENDDRIYTPSDLLPVCLATGTPLVYDAHHHRCNPDDLSIEEATEAALSTWDRKPLFHISSPREGWDAKNPRPHHDFIDPADVPVCWKGLDITVEVEAKAKEVAIKRLRSVIGDR